METEKRYCQTCGAHIQKHYKIAAAKYANRMYCSAACASEARKTRQQEDFNCLICGYLVSMKDPRWAGKKPSKVPKKYCSIECSAKARIRPDAKRKTCIHCGKQFKQKPDTTTDEWLKTRHCSKECEFPEIKVVDGANAAGKEKSYGKFWGEKHIVGQYVTKLMERGYCLARMGNPKPPVWRNDGDGYGVQWLFDYQTGAKTFHVTERKIVFKNYSQK